MHTSYMRAIAEKAAAQAEVAQLSEENSILKMYVKYKLDLEDEIELKNGSIKKKTQ